MLTVGDVVTAEVVSPREFGVFCRLESNEMLVVIPETSWIASFNSCLQFAQPGDRLTVKITNIDVPSGKIAASVREIHPDPWATGKFIVGARFEARVVRFVESADRCNNRPAYLVELSTRATYLVPAVKPLDIQIPPR